MDGVEALAFLHREDKYADAPRPDLILLDLNLPKKDGREVLAEIKADEDLRRIPVVILTTSKAEEDIVRTYNLHANCYINKPVDLDQFITVVQSIEAFWFSVVSPSNGRAGTHPASRSSCCRARATSSSPFEPSTPARRTTSSKAEPTARSCSERSAMRWSDIRT